MSREPKNRQVNKSAGSINWVYESEILNSFSALHGFIRDLWIPEKGQLKNQRRNLEVVKVLRTIVDILLLRTKNYGLSIVGTRQGIFGTIKYSHLSKKQYVFLNVFGLDEGFLT